MREHLYVGGTDLSTYGVYISGEGTFASPERENTFYDVPGRDGSVLGTTTKLRNIQVTYPAFIYANFDQNMRDLRSFLLSRKGYFRIEDTYDTTHFRMGVMGAPIDPDVTPMNNAGQFNIVFNCMPQRWLKSGETVITYTTNNTFTITNPTKFDAAPIIRAYGYGQFTVNSAVTVQIFSSLYTDYPSLTYIDIDVETMNMYNGDTYLGKYVTTSKTGATVYGMDIPKFSPGANTFRILPPNISTLNKIEITPRWWEV